MATRKKAEATTPKKTAGKSSAAAKPAAAPIELSWTLAELPSSQHKTGLAGLVLMVRWLERQPKRKGVCEITRIDPDGATLRIDQQGMRELFDETYAAATVERRANQLYKNKKKEVVPPLRTEEVVELDAKGKERRKTVYVYPATEPRGAMLCDLDDPASGGSGKWIGLWRSFVWGLLRAIPATRGPYEQRADGPYSEDADEAFKELGSQTEARTDLPSTYFIGAQASTAELVPFGDRVRFRFLLHFWPFAVGLYVPEVVDLEGKRDFAGYVLAFPDLCDLAAWCEEYPGVLKSRGMKVLAYLPAEAIIDVPAESALDLAGRAFKRLAAKAGSLPTSELLLGVDVFHVEKEGNNVRIRSTSRVEPTLAMTDEYERLRRRYWDPLFRTQILANHIAGLPLHTGFARLFAAHRYQHFFKKEESYFSHDARQFFTEESEVSE